MKFGLVQKQEVNYFYMLFNVIEVIFRKQEEIDVDREKIEL